MKGALVGRWMKWWTRGCPLGAYTLSALAMCTPGGTSCPSASWSFLLLCHSLAQWPLLTTAVMEPTASGVGDLGAVGENAPAVANAPIALERQIVAVLVALGLEPARVDGGDAAGLFQALGQY